MPSSPSAAAWQSPAWLLPFEKPCRDTEKDKDRNNQDNYYLRVNFTARQSISADYGERGGVGRASFFGVSIFRLVPPFGAVESRDTPAGGQVDPSSR
jgi:hypothetical protein